MFPDNFNFLKKKHSSALKFARKLSRKNKKYQLFYEGVKNHIELDSKFHKTILPPKIRKLKKKFDISTGLAHAMLELALDRNIYKEKRKKIDYLLTLFNKFNPKEIIYYLFSFLRLSEKIINKALETFANWVKLSIRFDIRAFRRRIKLAEQFFQKEFQKNASFVKNIFKIIPAWKYSIELTKDYKRYLG
jgi:hypothetical protein